jgi:arylsulfatase
VHHQEEDEVMKDKASEQFRTNTDLTSTGLKRRDLLLSGSSLVAASALSAVGLTSPAQAQQSATAPAPAGQQPNIVFIMGDDIGWFNIGAYHQGIMASRTPNLDKLAAEGMRFTDYYAEASCTAGRANFITGELPIRTGLTTVGQAGSPIGMPAQAPTIATVLKSMGYTTGQFGKNHLGDLNEFLPTVHGFDEFFGYLYHLDAMEDPAHRNYPQSLLATVGPRNMVHSWATNVDDPSVQARWGKIGKQRIEDAGPLYPSGWKRSMTRFCKPHSPSSTRRSRTTSRSSSGSTPLACTSSPICRKNTRTCATRKTAGRFPRAGSPSSTISSAP